MKWNPLRRRPRPEDETPESTPKESAEPVIVRPAPPAAPSPAASAIAVAVDHRTGPVDAGVAPDQDQVSLPPRPFEAERMSRADIVGEALARWAVTMGAGTERRSFLTHMRDAGQVLDLTHSHPSGLAQLLAGRGATRLSSLVREVGALADARAHARAIREQAERAADEIGLTTCHLAIGEATWTPADGGRPLQAPVLLRPITLRLRGNAREDVELDLDTTVDLNPVLLRALRDAGVAVDARALLATTDGPYGFDPTPVLDAFRALGDPLPGFRVSHALVVGNLLDATGAVVDDLESDPHDWVEHPLVAALAGDTDARTELTTAAQEAGDGEALDEAELVAAVDPDRTAVLQRVLAGSHLAVTVPPGTDGLGLVMDLAEELNARGRSVLLVSQRRSSLTALVHAAQERGLEDLVFDLSPDPALQRNASQALLQSLRRAGSITSPVSTQEPPELAEARSTLIGHVEAMHRIQEPWEASAHDAISALAELTRRRPAPRTTVRLRADVAAAMVGREREDYARALQEAAEIGVFATGPEDSAWYGAAISSDTQAARAADLLDELRERLLPQLRTDAGATGEAIGLRDATTLDELRARVGLLERVRQVLAVFQPAVFTAELGQMVAATGDRQWREEHGVTLGWGARRALRKEAAALQRPASLAPDLHAALIDARRVRDAWRKDQVLPPRTPSVPTEVERTEQTIAETQRVFDELAVLLDGTPAGGDLARTSFTDLEARAEALHRDRDDLESLPRRTVLVRRLEFDGLGELVEDLRVRRVRPVHVAAELELAWWRSVLELIAGAEPTISQYDGTSLSQVAERFRRLDAQHLAQAQHRVRSAADEVLVETMKRFPDTSRAAIAELARSSTISVRDLAAKYEDILFRARPTWIASPYLVPQVVPRGRHVDVVIIADGGRLPTAAGLPAIARGAQTVVVGDALEYAGGQGPSLLDEMRQVVPTVSLHRDPHVATDGVRSFAQRRSGIDPLLAVPSPVGLEPDRLVLVENGRGAVSQDAEYVESTEAELRRVTDLVIEHARTRPERSLAVLTLTPAHARRVMERVVNTVTVIPGVREFFDPGQKEFFTVAHAAQASALVRDDVIVSLGFGKTPHGRVLHRFGPLSEARGRQALATVLTRARGRTTVVSALAAEDLDPSRLRHDGTRDLRALLVYLRTGEDDLDLAQPADAPAEAPADEADLDAALDAALAEESPRTRTPPRNRRRNRTSHRPRSPAPPRLSPPRHPPKPMRPRSALPEPRRRRLCWRIWPTACGGTGSSSSRITA
ncbi:DUF4011 domain-containing protein [Brachybacterium sillae]|uniref:DUF4011 domain-containing protein n=1 Tax=Brachybacterium sillae TaxID=2810536 RepID=UPI00217ED957|nr:DUF4011 domain-containing protein [Brachybacterium sillae]